MIQAPTIAITGVCAEGWFSTRMTLAAYGRRRAQLERLDILFVQLEGDLA